MSAEVPAAGAATRSRPGEFWQGVRLSTPIVISATPFGVLFGALAVDNGMSVLEATFMSAGVYGGASQMVGIELFGQRLAPWLIVLSIFAVNFRHVLYSAAIRSRIADWSLFQTIVGLFFLVDPQFAEAERKDERGEKVGFVWYMGLALPVYLFWIAGTLAGAVFGGLVADPHALGVDFLLPIYFLGLVIGFRRRPLFLPVVLLSGVTSIVAYKLIGSPWHVSAGAAAGIVLAAAMPPKKAGAGR